MEGVPFFNKTYIKGHLFCQMVFERVQLTKPNQKNCIYRLQRSVPVISFPEKCAGANLEATIYKTSGVRKEGKKER